MYVSGQIAEAPVRDEAPPGRLDTGLAVRKPGLSGRKMKMLVMNSTSGDSVCGGVFLHQHIEEVLSIRGQKMDFAPQPSCLAAGITWLYLQIPTFFGNPRWTLPRTRKAIFSFFLKDGTLFP